MTIQAAKIVTSQQKVATWIELALIIAWKANLCFLELGERERKELTLKPLTTHQNTLT